LDRLDKDRDAKERAERKAYGEPGEEEKAATGANPTEDSTGKATTAAAGASGAAGAGDDMTFGTFKVEIRRGPAPDSSKGALGVADAAASARKLVESKLQNQIKVAEEALARSEKDTPAHKQAMSVVQKLNAQMKAMKLGFAANIPAAGHDNRGSASDSTDYHAIIPINDYPQKARWRVTNKETMVQLIDMTGASVTNKGELYPAKPYDTH